MRRRSSTTEIQVLDVRDLVDPSGCCQALADKARTIRMPVHVVEKLNKILRTERKLRASAVGSPARRRSPTSSTTDGRRGRPDPAQRADARLAREPVGDDEESEFGHFITDELAPQPEDVAEDILRKEALVKILGTVRARAAGAGAPVRPERRAAADAGRGRADVPGHARAHPADREPEPEEASRPGRLAEIASRPCAESLTTFGGCRKPGTACARRGRVERRRFLL